MADQDEFEPPGQEWNATKDCYVNDGRAEDVGKEILKVLPRVIRTIGGCPIFLEINAVLHRYSEERNSNANSGSLWGNLPSPFPTGQVNNALDDLALKTKDRRLDTVAIKSARIVACQLSSNRFIPAQPIELSNHLGASIIEHYICHRVLDTARALAVGPRFRTFAQSHAFHDQVLEYLQPSIQKFGAQLASDPTGQLFRRPSGLEVKHKTADILHDATNFSLEL